MKSVFLVASCVVFIVVTFGAAGDTGKTYYCVGKLVASMDGKSQQTDLVAWMKSPTKFRLEQKTARRTQIVISNGADVWMIDPTKKEGQHRTQDSRMLAEMSKQSRILGDDLDKLTKAGGQKTGSETVDGEHCDIYTLQMKNGLKHTVWIIRGPDKLTKKEKLTGTRMGAATPGAPTQNHIIDRLITYNWKIGTPMSESLFKPDAGVKVKEFVPPQAPAGGQMGGQMIPKGIKK